MSGAALLGRVLRRAGREAACFPLLHLRPRLEAARRARHWAGKGAAAVPRQILVAQLADIGDMVLTGPFLRRLRGLYPGARIVLAAAPHVAEFARGCRHVDAVAPFDFQALAGPAWRQATAGCPAWWREAAALREREFPGLPPDLGLSVRTNQDVVQAAAQVVLAGSHGRRLLGMPVKPLLGYFRSGLVLDRVVPVPRAGHEVERQAALFEALGQPAAAPGPLEPWITPNTAREAADVWRSLGWAEDRPVVGLGIGAGHMGKVWPAARFASLARRFRRVHIAVIGSAADREAGEEIARACGANAANLAGRMPLEVTAAFLARCGLFVGNDSGPLHLAAAAGVPVVGLYSREDPARWAPWTERREVLREAEIGRLEPEAVLAAARRLLPV
ncbi:MAG: glycosyltransferase family 9 protein [Verrucomicrobium sp.]|nr:glycosyltransferase family 9 protein [Verrucomicrobium sp.]